MPDEIGRGKLLAPDMDQVGQHDWVRGKDSKIHAKGDGERKLFDET